jgi:hypothetical protein
MEIMRHLTPSIILKNSLLLAVLFFMCMRSGNDNPFDSSYPAMNYKCKADWSTLPETCYVDMPYTIACTTSLGKDTFDHFKVQMIPPDPGVPPDPTVEFLLFKKISFNSFMYSINKELQGRLVIFGVRPNSLTVTDTSPVFTVIDHRKPRLDSLANTYGVLRGTSNILVNVRDTLDSLFTIFWQSKDSSAIDSATYTHSSLNYVCTLKVRSSAEYDTLKTWIRNSGHLSDVFSLNVFQKPFVPFVKIVKWPNKINYHDTLRLSLEVEPLTLNFKTLLRSKNGKYLDTSANYPNKKSNEIAMKSFVNDTGDIYLYVRIMDIDRKCESDELPCTLYVDPLLPLLQDLQSIQIPVGFPQKIEAVTRLNAAAKYHWKLGHKTSDPIFLDTLTGAAFITRSFDTQMIDTIYVSGINVNGYEGPAVGIVISVIKSAYLLSAQDTQFPSHVAARDSVKFEVAIDKPAQFAEKKGVFYWSIDTGNTTILNKSGPDISSITWYFPDSGIFQITVIARDSSGDSSNRFRKLVTVHRYAPQCWFEKREQTIYISQKDSIKLNYKDDLNPIKTGTVDTVFFDLNSDNAFEIARYRNPLIGLPDEIINTVGSYKIRAYVKDNDGFTSQIDSMTIDVISSAPYKTGNIPDTTILVHSKLSVHALFQVSEGQPEIDRYYWILNDNTMLSERTDALTQSFEAVGIDTIVVSCMNKNAVSSPRDTFVVSVVSEKKPVVNGMKPDTVWIFDDTSYSVNYRSLIPIVEYNVAWNLADTFMHFTTPLVKRQYVFAGAHIVKIYIVDKDRQSSDTLLDTVWVKKGVPQCDSIVPDTSKSNIFVNKRQTYDIWASDINGTIDYVKIFFDNGDTIGLPGPKTLSAKSVFPYTFKDTGNVTIKAIARDDDGLWSDTLPLVLKIRLGKPVVSSIKKDAEITIEARQHYTISASDSAGKIDSFFVSFNDGTSYLGMKDSIVDTVFSTTGKRYIKAFVKNDRGITSDIKRDSIIVQSFRSSIKTVRISIDVANDNIFVSDSRTFTVNGIDTVGKVTKVLFAWKEGIPFYDTASVINDTTFTINKSFNLSDTAIKNIRVRLINDRAQTRDSLYPISIRLGKPVVDALAAATIIVNDSTVFTVTAHDTNGTIDSFAINWGDGTPVVRKARSDAIKHAYAISQFGSKSIKITAKDDDGIYSDTALVPVIVHLDKPVIDGFAPATIWVNDDTTFAITAHDTNGTVDSFVINWGDGTAQTRKARTEVIKHKYSIVQSGSKTIKITAIDDDKILSDTSSFIVNVKLGKPWMKKIPNNDTMHWSDTTPGDYDTLVCPFRSAGNLTTIAVLAGDTNGSVKKVFWDVNNGQFTNSAASTIWTTSNQLTKDVLYSFKVWCMDDDSVMSDTLRFFVLPHTPPPQISGMNFQQGRLFWNGDGDPTTQYKVILKKSGSDSILVSDEQNGCAQCYSVGFKPGSQYDNGNYFSLSFDYSLLTSQIASSGNYWYKVYLRNSKGQISRCIGTPMLSF